MPNDTPQPTLIKPVPLVMPDEKQGVGGFLKGFLVLFFVLVVAGELAYDGDLSPRRQQEPQTVTRACVDAFRAHPLKFSFTADVTSSAQGLEGMDEEAAAQLLKARGYVLRDVTTQYADRMVYNDRVLAARREANHFWPGLLRHDVCDVSLFIKDGEVTGAAAQALIGRGAGPIDGDSNVLKTRM